MKKVIELHGYVAAYCNQGVIFAFNSLFSDVKLPIVSANDLIRIFRDDPEHWVVIPLSMVNGKANNGHFIVGTWENPNGSGHVVLAVSGETVNKKWQGEYIDLLVVMDTGDDMREESQSLSKSFGQNKHRDVVFYLFK